MTFWHNKNKTLLTIHNIKSCLCIKPFYNSELTMPFPRNYRAENT